MRIKGKITKVGWLRTIDNNGIIVVDSNDKAHFIPLEKDDLIGATSLLRQQVEVIININPVNR